MTHMPSWGKRQQTVQKSNRPKYEKEMEVKKIFGRREDSVQPLLKTGKECNVHWIYA